MGIFNKNHRVNSINKTSRRWLLPLPALALMAALLPASSQAAVSVGRMTSVSGTVDILTAGRLPALAATVGRELASGDLVRTKARSGAVFTYNNGTKLTIGEKSRITIDDTSSAKGGATLGEGTVSAIVRWGGAENSRIKYEIRTPTAITGVRGTNFTVSHAGDTTTVQVREGSVYFYNRALPGQQTIVGAGLISRTSGSSRPTPPQPAGEESGATGGNTQAPPAKGLPTVTQNTARPAARTGATGYGAF